MTDPIDEIRRDEIQLAQQVGADRGVPISQATGARLARPAPGFPEVVPGSQPVVAFGNLHLADVATLSINPSRIEFHTTAGQPLRDHDARLLLSDDGFGHFRRILAAYGACLNYFGRNPYRRWFDVLERTALAALDRSYDDSSACHLDLVQWATDPVWGGIADRARRDSYLEADTPFLADLLDEHDFDVLLLNGSQVIRQVTATGLVELETVGSVSLGNQGRRSQLVRGRRGRTIVLGWGLFLQHSQVTAANLTEVSAWLEHQRAELGLAPRPAAPAASYAVADGPHGDPVLGWPGGARFVGRDEFPTTEGSFDIDATGRALATGRRPWTAEDWIDLLAGSDDGRGAGELVAFDRLADACAEARRRADLRYGALAADASAAAPSVVAAPPVWETAESVWDGWNQFCEELPAAAASLAAGVPLPDADLAALRVLQQPATPPGSPHRFLRDLADPSACWACGAASTADQHQSWTLPPDEASPAKLTVNDLVAYGLEADAVRGDESPRSLWLFARYQVVRAGLGAPDLLAGDEGGAPGTGSALEDLLADLVGSYRRLREWWVSDGVLEAPSDWAPLLDRLTTVRDARTDLLGDVRALVVDVVLQLHPSLAERSIDTTVLRAAGVPTAEPIWFDEL